MRQLGALLGPTLGLALGLAGCFPVPAEIPTAPRHFDAKSMEGHWYMIATTLPMWKTGTKDNVEFSYQTLPAPDGEYLFADKVSFRNEGEPDSFNGVDHQIRRRTSASPGAGNGLLALVPTDWYAVHVSPKGWAIEYYDDNGFTPAGVDIIARTPEIPASELAAAHEFIKRDPFLRQFDPNVQKLAPYGSVERAPKRKKEQEGLGREDGFPQRLHGTQLEPSGVGVGSRSFTDLGITPRTAP